MATLAGGKAASTVDDLLKAAKSEDIVAVEALALFTGCAGDIAGDLTLTIGGRGGLFICSALQREDPTLFDRHRLRHRFEATGRMHGYVQDIPLHIVSTWAIGLIRLSTLFKPHDFRRG